MLKVRIRPGGIAILCLIFAALVYRLLYMLLWVHDGNKGPIVSLFSKKTAVAVAPLAPAADNAVPRNVPASATRMSNWLVFAPISLPQKGTMSDSEKMTMLLDSVGLPQEATLDPKPGDAGSVNGVTHKWLAAKGAELNFVSVVNDSLGIKGGNMPENVVGYAVTTVNVSRPTKNVTLYLGSDDSVAVWMNGRRIHRNAMVRGLLLGDDKISGLELKAGRNVFIFKVAQSAMLWSLAAALDIPK